MAWLYWNPERVLFKIPVIDHPVVWYGLWFVSGFIIGYFLLISIFKRRLLETSNLSEKDSQKQALYLVDQLTWFMIGGAIIGARLGHVLFYDLSRYIARPSEIFMIWKGGLASHGGTVGILIGLFFYQRLIRKKFPEFSYIVLMDSLAIVIGLGACFIRIGNFFNQEILGVPSNVPWAIIFGDPLDGGEVVPRHPVMLYEAVVYFFTFVILLSLWTIRGTKLPRGLLSGLFLILVFGSRILLDFLKMPQSNMINESYLQMGQYLSIPLVIVGIALLWFSLRSKRVRTHTH